MKKRILLLMLIFSILCTGGGEINSLNAQNVIHWGTPATNGNDYGRLPFASQVRYSTTQQIYLKSELEAFAKDGKIPSGNITKLEFFSQDGSTTKTFNGINVYMKNTSQEKFASTSDWDKDFSETDKVFSGSATMTNGVLEIPLTGDGFKYDGQSNVILYFDVNSSNGTAQINFQNYQSDYDYYTSLYQVAASPNTGIDAGTWKTGSRKYFKNTVKFTFGGATPTAPSFTDLYANPKGDGHFKPYFSFYVENATHYQVLLSTSDDMSNPSYIAGAAGSFVAMTDAEIEANQVTLNGNYNLSYNETYYWQVIARNGEDAEAPTTSSTVYSFTTRNITEVPGGISEIAPANNTVITGNPELSWSFGSDTEEYRVLLGTSATLNENDVKIDWTYFPIEVYEASYQTSNLEAGTYYWQVQTRNQIGTNEGTVYSFTKVGAPGNVTPISPADGATEVINTATLSWTFAPYTEEYRVLMDSGEGFVYVPDNNWIETGGAETAEYTPEGIGGGETVSWCVEVRNASASLNNPAVFTYTTSNLLPVENISPVNDFRLDGETATLEWNFQGDATHYQVMLGKDQNNMEEVLGWTERDEVGTGLVTEGSFETVNLDHNSRYYWQVNVKKGENTREGEKSSFITILDNPQNVTPAKEYLYYEDNGVVRISWNQMSQMSGIEGLNIYVGTATEPANNTGLIQANQQYYDVTVPTYITSPQTITVKAVYEGLGESTGSTTQVEVVGYATVNGTITDDKNQQPVKGVTVTYSGTDRVGKTQNIVFTTGADGKYSGTVPVGTYSITAVKEDYSEYSADAKYFGNGVTMVETIPLVSNLAFDIYIRTNTAMELEFNLTNDAWQDLEEAPGGYYTIYLRTKTGDVVYGTVMFTNNLKALYMLYDSDVQDFNTYWANLPNGTYNVGVAFSGKDYINWSENIERNYHIFMASNNNNDWNDDLNWFGGLPGINDNVTLRASVVVAEESDITVANVMIEGSAALTINGTLNANDVTITKDASLVINGILNANEVINQGAIGKLLINDGGQLYRTDETLLGGKFVKNIKTPSNWETTKDGWQLMASPFTNEDQTYTYFTQFTNGVEDYDLYKYNGSGLKEWINIKDTESNGNTFGDTFVNGTGYLVAYKSTSNVALTGSFKSGTSYTIGNLVYDAEKDLANFHLLGNPFPFNMDWSNVEGNRLVEGFAVLNEDGDNYEYKTSGTIKVGEGFFIRTRAAVGTELGDPSFTHSITRGAEKETVNSLNVIATGNVGKDNVVINFAGESEGFPKLQNFNDAIATVYVQDNGANYGIYNCDENTTEVELCFNANQMGNYTISVEDSEEFEAVILVDRFTGIETNMLLEDYTFTAMSDVNNNRFILKLAVSDQQSAVSDNFVYQSGEELIVEAEGTVQIIDMMGRVVYNNDVTSDNNRINVSDFNNGAYVVRVINESEIKVEKVVIY